VGVLGLYIINEMDTISAAALASELGTSVPRVTRAARRMGFDGGPPGRRFSFTPGQANRLRAALGLTPEAEGLSRSQVIVLAALRNAPFGLVSARAVARRSGLSATAAGRALASLEAMGLVERAKETIAVGRAEERTIWRANVLHPRRPALDPVLARVKRPQTREASRKTGGRVPPRLRHLFWNTAESQLDVDRAGPYIARRLLQTMDIQGLAWGAGALASADWEAAARTRGLDAKTRRLALNLAAGAP
jgi:MarR family